MMMMVMMIQTMRVHCSLMLPMSPLSRCNLASSSLSDHHHRYHRRRYHHCYHNHRYPHRHQYHRRHHHHRYHKKTNLINLASSSTRTSYSVLFNTTVSIYTLKINMIMMMLTMTHSHLMTLKFKELGQVIEKRKCGNKS